MTASPRRPGALGVEGAGSEIELLLAVALDDSTAEWLIKSSSPASRDTRLARRPLGSFPPGTLPAMQSRTSQS